ncbi:alpha/beta hydrolase [Nocardia speluncae]|uniref:Alpha/beta hydrolase n=1 Tax=Nocardia speluncae TaxID=419477 RepID=A0A846XIV4_9NOCA|nr:alpha/beta hydrolase [Nocardia speluncae]
MLRIVTNANNLLDPVQLRLRGAGGIELVADRYGPADGPTALFLHGGGQTRHSWKQTGAQLGAAGIRAVTLDARGHGDSEWALDRDYRYAAMVGDVFAVLEQLGGGPAVLVGASMGGITGLLSTAAPGGDAISALVLVDIVTRPEPEGVDRVVTFLNKNPEGFATVEEAADAVAEYMPHRPRPKSSAGLLRNLRQRDGRWYWHWDPGILGDKGHDPDEMARDLEGVARALTIPVLLVRGLKSDVVSAEGAAEFQALVPHAEIAEIGNAAHTAAGDDNDAFTEAVTEFVLRARHI